MPDSLLDQFVDIYQRLDKNRLQTLREVYSEDVIFEDALHKLQGIDELIRYFENQYQNLNSCSFTVLEAQQTNDSAWLIWQMRFSHPKLRNGEEIDVPGASHLRLQEKISYHRDYVDMGQVLYEHVPVLGRAVRWIKQRAVQ